jgi:hypothetical protein
MTNNFLNGIAYTNTGDERRGTVQSYHGKPSPLNHSKTPYTVDVIGLKPMQRRHAILTEGGVHESKFTIGFEVEKNVLHRGAVKEYPLFCGFERDGSCGYEAVTHILPLLPEGKWRNKVYDLFVQAEKIIDSRYSPADRRCGGHVTVGVKGKTSDEIRKALRPLSGILLALYESRISNGYCNGNLRMQPETERSHFDGPNNRGGSRYKMALLKQVGYNEYVVEFRIPSKFESVKQTMRRYELFYAMLDFAFNVSGVTHEKFLAHIRPIVLSMYGGDVAKTEEKLQKARHYRKFIMDGKIDEEVAHFLDPNFRHPEMHTVQVTGGRVVGHYNHDRETPF